MRGALRSAVAWVAISTATQATATESGWESALPAVPTTGVGSGTADSGWGGGASGWGGAAGAQDEHAQHEAHESDGSDDELLARMRARIEALRARIEKIEEQGYLGAAERAKEKAFQGAVGEIMDMPDADATAGVEQVNNLTEGALKSLDEISGATSVGEGNAWNEE